MIAFIADIHGNLAALKAILNDIKKNACTQIICLGDIAGYYCQINEVIELCERNNIINIFGNHDFYLLHNKKCQRSSTANICIEHQLDVITQPNYNWLKSSRLCWEQNSISLVHGSWKNPLEEYLNKMDWKWAHKYPAAIFGSAHTHIQSIEINNNKIWFNPGSVGQPRDGDPRAAYAFIDKRGNIRLQRVAYNIDETVRAMKAKKFHKRFYENLYYGRPISSYTSNEN